MEPAIALIVLLVLGVPLALAIWLIVRAVAAKNRINELSDRLHVLEVELIHLRQEKERAKTASPATSPTPAAPPPKPSETPKPPVPAIPTPSAPKPPPPISTVPPQAPVPKPAAALPKPPIVSAIPIDPLKMPPSPKPAPAINWEQFMGVKGFAWVGGFALFLGVAFFVKYSFDNNLVPPELRVAIGFLAGIGLLVGGVILSRKNFAALSQTLCATGVVILYAVTFACRSIYHFDFFGPVPTFLLMVLITATAFLLAVRLEALVVAILGMLGGFLTPVLLSTGQDNPVGLFGYVAILDIGLIFVALHRRWFFLVALAALGTVVMQAGWASEFFESGKYFDGNNIFIPLAVLLGFNLLYLGATAWSRRRDDNPHWLSASTLGLAAVTFTFMLWFLDFPTLAQRPWLMFSFLFLIDAIVITVTCLDKIMLRAQSIAGLVVFGWLGLWTQRWLANDLLNAALIFYFVFALVHTLLPVVLQRRFGINAQKPVGHLFPIFTLALVLVPIFKLTDTFAVWPFILLVDLLAIVLAVLTSTLLPVLAVLLLTLAAISALIFKIPADLTGLPVSFFLLAGFVIFFFTASIWLIRKFKPEAMKSGIKLDSHLATPGDLAAILPACSAVLPFLLLIMATLRLPLVNPSPVFGLALLLVVLVLGVTKLFSLDWMPAIGLTCVAALECSWHFNRFDPSNLHQPLNLVLAWYLVFFAVFTVFPFLFLKKFGNRVVPWAAAAMAGLPQFLLVHRFVTAVHPNQMMGLLPAAFAVPPLIGLIVILKRIPADNKARMTQVAWFGGVALFFITLIFPIQFDRQWITIGWALEGAALLWLFHRVPHGGLRLVGVGLLVTAFVRLAFNPAVFEYHSRAATPIFNWYLYAYGIVTVALFAGASLLASPRNKVGKLNAPPFLAALGTVLAFLLLNIEIADYFSEPGSTLTFQFSGNFARDMTYSIAWASFALGLLIYGIVRKVAAARYTAMGLLCVTLLKLFFHDLAQLGQLYRIGALVGVAIIAMLASFAYQKFFAAGLKEKESKNET